MQVGKKLLLLYVQESPGASTATPAYLAAIQVRFHLLFTAWLLVQHLFLGAQGCPCATPLPALQEAALGMQPPLALVLLALLLALVLSTKPQAGRLA